MEFDETNLTPYKGNRIKLIGENCDIDVVKILEDEDGSWKIHIKCTPNLLKELTYNNK